MSEALQALWASVVRTVTPAIVGAITSALVAANLTISEDLEATLSAALFAIFTSIYYIIVRVLETYVAPRFGWLLLLPKSPTGYSRDATHSDTPTVTPAADDSAVG